jgi:PAS domain S-box-containing protein
MTAKKREDQRRSNYLTDKQFKALIENAHEGILLYDRDGSIKYSSHSVSNITGYREKDVLQRTGTEFIHADDRSEAANAFYDLVDKPGRSVTLFHRIRHKKGHYIWCESRLTNFSHVPEINGIVSNFRDVTARRLAEEKARKSQELLETVTRNLSEGIFMGVIGKGFSFVNDAFLNITGYKSFAEVEKLGLSKIFRSGRSGDNITAWLHSKSELKGFEIQLRKKNGTQFWAVLHISRLKHEGKSDHIVGTILDVTREKEANLKQAESQNFINNIINTVAAPIFVKDHRHRWVMFNDKFCELIGRSRQQLFLKTDADFLPRDEVEAFYKIDSQVLKTGKTVTTEEILTGSGSSHHLMTVKSRYVNEKDERYVIGFITEITHLKKAEEEIKQLHANLEGVLESSEESIFAVDKSLCYIAFNERHRQIMKLLYGVEIKIGMNKVKCLKRAPDRKWVNAELLKALEDHHFVSEHYQQFPSYTGFIQTTYNPIHDDQKNVKGVAVFVQDISHRKRYEEIINTINANLRAVMESTGDGILAFDRNFRCLMFNNTYAKHLKDAYGIRIAVGDNFLKLLPKEIGLLVERNAAKAFRGQRVTIVHPHATHDILETSFNPVHDDKVITGAAMFVRNITERTTMEESVKALNKELTSQNVQLAFQGEELKSTLEELSERNFELDQLMYKTSHDLRSPLSSIMGLINLATLDRDPEALQEYLSKIEGRVKKLDDFICSMLDYARVNRVEVNNQPVDLVALAKNCIQELEYLDSFQKVKAEIICDSKSLVRSLDKLRLKIIFSNIISNAYKYVNTDVSSYLKVTIDSTGSDIRIEFSDNGIGIKDEHKDKIFNMFYRATDRSQGSGLGMYIVKQAVEKLNGKVTLSSIYAKGTTIKIVLPIVRSKA